MEMIDPAGEFLRITERYRQMSDEELLLLIPQSSDLTDVAQQALATEIRSRGLKTEGNVEVEKLAAEKLKVENEKPSALRQARLPAFVLNEPAHSRDSYGFDSTPGDLSEEASAEEFRADESPYDEDRKLVELCTVWSLSDALKLQSVLDNAGIPFFIGPEKATGVDAVTSDFSDGLSVQVMQIGFPWARQAMKNYYPEDYPPPQEEEQLDDTSVRCPKCHSMEVVFDELTAVRTGATGDASSTFKWTCDSCGHEWEDDGVVRED